MNDYQAAAYATAIFPDEVRILYPALGLAGEVGEVLNKIKKHYRDGVPLDREALKAELGDVLWYVAVLAEDLDISLEMAAQDNLAKLQSRKSRGTLQGSGDNR